MISSYPEQPPEEVPELVIQPDPIRLAGSVANNYDSNFWGNAMEAESFGEDVHCAMANIYSSRGQIQSQTGRLAELFMRQVQAQQAFETLFFEKVNQAYGQFNSFVTRNLLAQAFESEAESAWRAQLEPYNQTALALPGLSRAVQLCVTPCIRTALPAHKDSELHGYLSNQDGSFKDKHYLGGTTTASSIQLFPAPIVSTALSTCEPMPKEYPQEAQSPSQASRTLAAVALHELHTSFGASLEPNVKTVEALSVVPSISQVGAIASIDMCLQLSGRDYSQSSPGAYLVQLFYNGQPLQQKLIDGISSSGFLGGTQEEPIAGMRQPKTLPRLPSAAFSRSEEDATMSLIALPVRKSHTPASFSQKQPIQKLTNSIGSVTYMQHEPSHPSYMAHIALVASF